MEDPLATEQRAKQRKSLTDAAASPKKGSDSKVFELFGDFDVDALFEDLEEVPQSKTPEAAGAGGAVAPEGDIDDFFDALGPRKRRRERRPAWGPLR
ncbi:unnamed protein product [Effrenium voratum]|uniref:Uncharacterized protein n=1 Tax=Effrenium voratum TaxID=2562239 RepID=A0AA36NFJ5_9DINO|nr:unnamed protein product [Effrenium voratum]